jgi:hypothetical protein
VRRKRTQLFLIFALFSFLSILPHILAIGLESQQKNRTIAQKHPIPWMFSVVPHKGSRKNTRVSSASFHTTANITNALAIFVVHPLLPFPLQNVKTCDR